MRARRHDLTLYCSLAVVLLLIATALAAPLIAPYDPDAVNLEARFTGPGSAHWMGTDDLGRDVFSRVVTGSRISLTVGILATLLSFVIGTTAGAAGGYFGSRIDWLVLRLIEGLLSFPLLFIVLAIVALFGASMTTLILALGLTSWPVEARLVRGEVMRAREREFALAAKASGASDVRLIIRHLLPHAIPPAIVSSSFGVATVILSESALSFIGLGIPLPRASWGNILATAETNLEFWWLAFFPGLAILVATTAFYFLGDALRRRLDPRLTSRLTELPSERLQHKRRHEVADVPSEAEDFLHQPR
jgi:peptide/nickel transport system permease protein